MYEVHHLFEARKDGYRVYRVPGILATDRGTVLATAEARRGRGGDWDANDVLMRRSVDGGGTWLPRQTVVRQTEYGEGPVSNFIMIADGDRIQALFCHNYKRIFSTVSEDEGESWSRPREITEAARPLRELYPWRVIAAGPGHGIRLGSGRFIVPLWMSTGEGSEFGSGKLGHRPSAVSLLYSDDRGGTWLAGHLVAAHGDENVVNPSETLAVELSDDRVLLNIRNEGPFGRRLISISPDGVSGWSKPEIDDALLEPVCMGSLLKLREKGSEGKPLLLFANPDNLENNLIPPGGHLAHDRKRLTAKLSSDDGQTWPVSRVLEPGPSGYSDLAQTPDGVITCIHEDQTVERMCDDRFITVRRFDLKWVQEGPGP